MSEISEATDHDASRWDVRVQGRSEFGMPRRFYAVAPGCPMRGHPIRNCECTGFRSRFEAQQFANEGNTELAANA
jgi:hypothetical protein